METSRIPATLAALLAGLVLLLAGASRQLVHCTSSDGSTRIELQRDAQGCHGSSGCQHRHAAAPTPRCCEHDAHGEDDPGLPAAGCGGECDHVALTVDLADGPRPGLRLPPPIAAPAPAPPTGAGPKASCSEPTPQRTGPPRPPGWLAHRATIVLQL